VEHEGVTVPFPIFVPYAGSGIPPNSSQVHATAKTKATGNWKLLKINNTISTVNKLFIYSNVTATFFAQERSSMALYYYQNLTIQK
jgi:hypothetical protein